jgi:hypothetical protein
LGAVTVPSTRRSGAQLVADLAIFAPLGLVITAAEAVPDLAGKARARLIPRVGLARTVGQFAVRQGYRQLSGLAGGFRPGQMPWSGRTGRSGPPRDATSSARYEAGFAGPPPGRTVHHRPAEPSTAGKARDVPSSADLAIPSYDSLSAPQVVQRLAGLSRDEIEAVRRYEGATRGRRTVLARAEQLLS